MYNFFSLFELIPGQKVQEFLDEVVVASALALGPVASAASGVVVSRSPGDGLWSSHLASGVDSYFRVFQFL